MTRTLYRDTVSRAALDYIERLARVHARPLEAASTQLPRMPPARPGP